MSSRVSASNALFDELLAEIETAPALGAARLLARPVVNIADSESTPGQSSSVPDSSSWKSSRMPRASRLFSHYTGADRLDFDVDAGQLGFTPYRCAERNLLVGRIDPPAWMRDGVPELKHGIPGRAGYLAALAQHDADAAHKLTTADATHRTAFHQRAAEFRGQMEKLLSAEKAAAFQDAPLSGPSWTWSVSALKERQLAIPGLRIKFARLASDVAAASAHPEAVLDLDGRPLPFSRLSLGDRVYVVPQFLAGQDKTPPSTLLAAGGYSPMGYPSNTLSGRIVSKDNTFIRVRLDNVPISQSLLRELASPTVADSWVVQPYYFDTMDNKVAEALNAMTYDIDLMLRIRPRGQSAAALLPSLPSGSATGPGQPPTEEQWVEHEIKHSGCAVMDIILDMDSPPPTRHTRSILSDCPGAMEWVEAARRGDRSLKGGEQLNHSQRRAIANFLERRVSLIQGPPGTGKTRTIAEAIKLLRSFHSLHPVLLAAHTHVAVDNLTEAADRAGLRVVRVGKQPYSTRQTGEDDDKPDDVHYTTARPPRASRLEELSLNHYAKEHPLWGAYTAAQHDYLSQKSGSPSNSSSRSSSSSSLMPKQMLDSRPERPSRGDSQRRQARAHFIWQQITRDILRSADVVCCTVMSSGFGSEDLAQVDFPVVIMDEASTITQPVGMIPLMKGCQHLCLVGDHKQLPPVVRSEYARSLPASRSLFTHLIEQLELDPSRHQGQHTHGLASTMLDEQYRMHPTLSEFSRYRIYGGQLADDPSTCSIKPLQSQYLASSAPRFLAGIKEGGWAPSNGSDPGPPGKTQDHLAFLQHSYAETRSVSDDSPEESGDGSKKQAATSYYNTREAHLAVDVAVDLLVRNQTLPGNQVGIITPYAAQMGLILGVLSERAMDLQLQEGDESKNGRTPTELAAHLRQIQVDSVESFQGRQKEAVIFSTVRSNKQGYVGFLANARRLNVALTRAQRGLFVIGNSFTWHRAATRTHRTLESITSRLQQAKASFPFPPWNQGAPHVEAEGLADPDPEMVQTQERSIKWMERQIEHLTESLDGLCVLEDYRTFLESRAVIVDASRAGRMTNRLRANSTSAVSSDTLKTSQSPPQWSHGVPAVRRPRPIRTDWAPAAPHAPASPPSSLLSEAYDLDPWQVSGDPSF